MLLSNQQHLASAASPDRAIALPLELAKVYSIYYGSLSTNHRTISPHARSRGSETREDSMHPQGHIEEREGGKHIGHKRENHSHWLNYTKSKSFFHVAIKPTVFM